MCTTGVSLNNRIQNFLCSPVYRIHVTVGVENVQIAFTDHITWGLSSQGYPKFSRQIRVNFGLSFFLYLR